MSARHTAAPWVAQRIEDSPAYSIRGPAGELVAAVDTSCAEGNAHLVAAAPEMLAALLLLRDIERGGEIDGAFRVRLFAALERADIAIAKATETDL